MPLDYISETLAVPLDTVAKWSSKGKWKMRLALSGASRSIAIPSSSKEITDEEFEKLKTLPFEEKQSIFRDGLADEALRALRAMQNVPTEALVQNADKLSKLEAVARRGLRIEDNKPACLVNIHFLAGLPHAVVDSRETKVLDVETTTTELSPESN